MYPENAASAMQKCLNQLACHLDSEWGGQRNCVLDGQLDVDIVPPGKYSWTIVCDSSVDGDAASSQITFAILLKLMQ